MLEFDQRLCAQSSLLRPYALRLTGDPVRAGDLIQDSLLKALLHRDKFRPGTDLKAWMRTITKHTFINQYRRQRSTRGTEGDPADLARVSSKAPSADDPFSAIAVKELRTRMESLPAGVRDVLMMLCQGYKYEEIAARMGLPLGTVKSRIHTARQQLRSAEQRISMSS